MQRLVEDRAARVRFRRAVVLMLMTLVVPGSAQLVAGNRRVGRIATRIWLATAVLVVGCLLLTALWPAFALKVGSDPTWLGVIRFGLVLLAVGWVALFMDAWRLGQPLTLPQRHRLAVVGLNGFLSLGMAAVLLFGSHLVAVQRDFLVTTFGDGAASAAHGGRYHVLLLGGDAGRGRWGMRADSVTVASIDADTGRTVLFGLPRNMTGFPFAEGSVMAEQFPDGFDCDGCYLNSVGTWAGDNPELFGQPADPSGEELREIAAEATTSAVEGITGLPINYRAVVNLAGFRDLVDAVGGVTLRVRDRIPVGGLGDKVTGYLEPGVRRLDGHDTLWFARAREGSDDYSRMARQKCVMGAMLEQIDPTTMLTNFSDITEATSGMVQTDLPASELDRFVELALAARSQQIATVSFVPPLVDTADPDIELIHERVEAAIAVAEGRADPPERPQRRRGTGPGAPAMTGGSLGSLREGYAANESDDLGRAC